jgi:hypothetical protein
MKKIPTPASGMRPNHDVLSKLLFAELLAVPLAVAPLVAPEFVAVMEGCRVEVVLTA